MLQVGRLPYVLMAIGILMAPVSSHAQGLGTGNIAGAVVDASGAVLPGVVVEASSPALIEKVRTSVTDSSGQYRIVELRSGLYTVTFTLPGFNTFKRDGIEVVTGVTASVNAEMKVGSLEETVTVTGASPVVDVQNVRSQSVLTDDVLTALPGGRSVGMIARLVVGATANGVDTSGAGGLDRYAGTIHGTGAGQQSVDGVRVTAVFGGGTTQRMYNNSMNTQEMVVDYSGISAEAESGGLNLNIVSKDGGNSFRGSVAGEFANKALQSDNLTDEVRARGVASTPKIQRIYDAGVGFGGRIIRDRLWFYTAHRAWGYKQDIPGLYFNATQNTLFYTPDLSRPAYQDQWNIANNINTTWQVTQKNKVKLGLHSTDYCTCYFTNFPNTAPEARHERRFWPNYLLLGAWTYPMTSRVLIEAGSALRGEGQKKLPTAEALNGITYDADSGLVTSGTAVRPVKELSTGFSYGSGFPASDPLDDYGNHGTSGSVNNRISVSYVTGTHNIKAGMTVWNGWAPARGQPFYNVQYQFNNQVPSSLFMFAAPNYEDNRVKYNLGLFVQDQWTVKRLTLNLGVRFDALNSYVPAHQRPAGEFLGAIDLPEQKNLPNWKDVNPRFGAAYDLFGDGKTAVKATLGRYVQLDATTITRALQSGIQATTTRTWNDRTSFPAGDPRNGNYVPDCDLKNPAANGECGAMANQSFGTPTVVTQWSKELTEGFGVRPYNWQTSVTLQRELMPGVGTTVGYYRTTYGNFRVTDNILVGPQDYDQFCVTAPVDARLPNSGQQVCGFYNLKNSKLGQTSNLTRPLLDSEHQSNVYNGIDATVTGRFARRGFITGGFSVGNNVTDSCGVTPDSPQLVNCHVDNKTILAKVSGNYELPWWGIALAPSLVNDSGAPWLANYNATNAEVLPTLGRNLGACAPTLATCNALVSVPLLAPNTLREPRTTQLDLRIAKIVRAGHLRIAPALDIFNVFNASGITGTLTSTYGPSWLNATSIVAGRILKFSAQVDF